MRDEPALLKRIARGRKLGPPRNVELALVESRIADLFFRTGKRRLLHIEIQTWNARNMAVRSGVYALLAAEKFDVDYVDQVVLYAGRGKMKMRDRLDIGAVKVRFRLINVDEISAAELLRSENPVDWVIAMLGRNGTKMLKTILRRILALPMERRGRLLAQLMALSGLRGLSERLKMEFKAAGVEIDIESNVLLREIRDAGYEKGLAEGEARGEKRGERRGEKRGHERGRAEGQAQLLHSLLEAKFGKVPAWADERLAKASLADMQRWGAKILTARSIESALNGR